MGLIDKDALKGELCNEYSHIGERIKISPVFRLIRDAPIIDTVEVVRCKDCKWWETYKGKPEQYKYNCYQLEVFTNSDFFCANGIRMRTDATFN